ncbi:hypothetical protein LOZ61_001578 [Ophidiomyces ophidiicola]|nr:hypothetical protein LOZ61_001578 [Ophidiomyces ophidiicola]KAI1925424.1 hypothetical protein LOZ60_004152 [Ophidiomyces ophidiicola]KAI1964414.1 hypothetical protein LOZ59_001447 [Ophidiomyces ophidiicola]KAI2099239.1 hypothetical protein LOZ33_002588 [Ophidiomyces ophidiicola]KAI2127313.1 hypothetical protein LOZ31_002694 [Ophidiomyces ophidiicola]
MLYKEILKKHIKNKDIISTRLNVKMEIQYNLEQTASNNKWLCSQAAALRPKVPKRMSSKFQRENELPKGLKVGVISPIYKDESFRMDTYIPIALDNSDYKLHSEILGRRLRKTLALCFNGEAYLLHTILFSVLNMELGFKDN